MAKIDISGYDGTNGICGVDGYNYGSNGSNAGFPNMGEDGDVLDIYAKGGKGGKGGYGGNGASGSPGSDGSDATQNSSGTDGGPGGNGGNGGNGTPGANGGKGGFVQITVTKFDMDLLVLIGEIDIAGGQGGEPGRNGKGGKGGPGGRGGSSYSWSETSYSTTTDSDGNTQTESSTQYYSNPGGSNGPDGKDGRHGSGNISPGQDGKKGKFEYLIEYSDLENQNQMTLSFKNKYDLKITGFRYQMYEDDGIIEPGERAFIDYITVSNRGEMPTPNYSDFEVSLQENLWLMKAGQCMVPRNLQSKEVKTFETKVDFIVNYPSGPQYLPKPRLENTEAQVQVYIPSLDRYLPNAIVSETHKIKIEYPLQIEQFQCLRTFSPGQTAKIIFTLFNKSKLAIAGDKRSAQIFILAGSGDFDSTEFQIDVPVIKKNSKQQIICNITIPPQVQHLLRSSFIIEFYLHDPRNQLFFMPCIHTFPYDIRIGFDYIPKQDSDVLFIINENFKLDDLDFIEKTCQYYGLKHNYYDLSMTGHLNLFQIQEESKTNLAQDLQLKTIVLINSQFLLSSTSQDLMYGWTLEFLKKEDMLRATQLYRIHFVIFSPHKHNYNSWTVKYDQEGTYYKEIDDFLKEEYKLSQKSLSEKIGTTDFIVATKAFLSFKSRKKQVETQAKHHVRKIQKRFPYQSYVSCHVFSQDEKDKDKIGHVAIMRTPPFINQYVAFMDFNDIISNQFDFAFAILCTIDIKIRTNIALNLVSEDDIQNKHFDPLIESLMFSLGREIEIGCHSKHSTKFEFEDFSSFLKIFKVQLKHNKSLNIQPFDELIIRLKKLSKKQEKLTDVIIFWVAHAKLLRKLNKKLKAMSKLLKHDKESLKQHKMIKEKISKSYDAKRKQFKDSKLPKYLLLSNLDLERDTYRSWVSFEKVISEDDIKQFQANEQKHRDQCFHLVDYKKKLDQQLKN
ncbi:UNKNOWN [Stylonychia lemnae]|uniref:DUF7932 domain-containing protein n=1 Tax=Stylonychia lemnae TaxID=5949 RepID=A0A078B6W6_STYLE|nr:UNKNOWN [Stylonychia lemnae]|eukprot:CDW90129.1 UNKNOWN [Stylonychia lemnae]